MGDVDAILRSGEYTDRRGMAWGYVGLAGLWVLWADPFPMVWRAAKGRWWHGTGWAVNEYPTFAEAIAAAHNMAGETP